MHHFSVAIVRYCGYQPSNLELVSTRPGCADAHCFLQWHSWLFLFWATMVHLSIKLIWGARLCLLVKRVPVVPRWGYVKRFTMHYIYICCTFVLRSSLMLHGFDQGTDPPPSTYANYPSAMNEYNYLQSTH
ncbi:hypothetical protein BDV19DRAFT_5744 [Aspergillus venezuelensis]